MHEPPKAQTTDAAMMRQRATRLVALALLASSGAALGFALWQLAQGEALVAFLTHNDRVQVSFAVLPKVALAGAAALVLAGMARARGDVELLFVLSQRASPLLAFALLPPLFHWQAWTAQPLAFLVLASIVALCTRALLANALAHGAEVGPLQLAWLPARVARHAGRLPLLLVVLGALCYALYFGRHTVANHHNLGTASYDLAIFDNLVWNVADRGDPGLPSTPADGPVSRHLSRHATFVAFLVAPLYSLAPRAETLLWLQSIFIALAALPLYFLAARQLGAWSACPIALAYLLQPAVHGPNLYDFHFLTMTPLLAWTSLNLLETRRDLWAALTIAVTLSIREDAAAGLAILGAYLIVTRQRPRAGLLLSITAIAYAGFVKLVVMPGSESDASFIGIYRGLIPQGGESFFDVLTTAAANPAFTLRSLLTPEKLIYALQIAVPLAFLPWLRPLGWICSVPGLVFCLLATHAPPLVQISFQYAVHFTVYVFLALIASLRWLEHSAVTPQHGRARRRAALAALAIATLAASYQFGAVLQQNTARAGYGAFVFGSSTKQRANYAAVRALIAQVPASARIVATESLVPHVSNRRFAYTLRVGSFDAEYLLAKLRHPLRSERDALKHALESGQFGVVDLRRGFALAKRGYQSGKTAAALRLVR